MSEGFSASKRSLLLQARAIILGGIILGSFAIYAYILFTMQVVNSSEYKERADKVAQSVKIIPTLRGEIYDRNNDVPLVTNLKAYAVNIIASEIPESSFDRVTRDLAAVLEMPLEELLAKIPRSYLQRYQPAEIKSGLSYDKVVHIAERKEDFPGVTWNSKQVRTYVDPGSMSHILGYVGTITREELQVLYNKGYKLGDTLGKSGIESQYDFVLRGEEGKQYNVVDSKGRSVQNTVMNTIPPELGKNLVLTIDRDIQLLCEKALGKRIGSVVVLKPATGEVLAMVSYPYYNPNIFYTERGAVEFKRLSDDSMYPFLNRTIQSSYAPASVFKIVMSSAIIEEDVYPLDKKVDCTGSISLGDRTFRCWKRTGHGPLNLGEALTHSCDVYYYNVGRDELGMELIGEYARMFGLGSLTGIDLGGEVRGLVPSPEWKKEKFSVPWVGGDTVNTTIGQGYLSATPLQMANIVAMVLNDGIIYRPHVLKEVRDPITDEIIDSTEREVIHTAPIHIESFEEVRSYMRSVVTDGEVQHVMLGKSTEIAAKTGTAEVGIEDKFHSWFAAYAPYDTDDPNEQIVVVTMTEARNEWDWWAPKAADLIFQGIFADQTFEEVLLTLQPWWWEGDP